MGPPSYMRTVVDRNFVMRRIPVICSRPTALTTLVKGGFHNHSPMRDLTTLVFVYVYWYIITKSKMFTLEQATKAHRQSRGVTVLFL